MFENLNFGKTEFKTSVFEKHFISYSCILFIKYYALNFMHKIALFFKKLVFPGFQSIESVSRPIEIAIKIYAWLCVFRSIEHRVSGFFKTVLWLIQTLFQKLFSNFSLSLQLGKAAQSFFYHFLSQFFKVFLPQGWQDHFIPPFVLIFLFSCIFSCI